MSSVTSGTAGLLVRHLCKESDSYTPCHDTDSTTYNIKLCNMSSCKKLPLYSYSTCRANGAQLDGLWSLVFFFGILCGQQQGLNKMENSRDRSRQNNVCLWIAYFSRKCGLCVAYMGLSDFLSEFFPPDKHHYSVYWLWQLSH